MNPVETQLLMALFGRNRYKITDSIATEKHRIETMGRRSMLILLIFLVNGVFGDEVTVSGMEGDSVTLFTDIIKHQHDKILWYSNGIRIALINGHPNTSCLYDGEGGIFRDRLEVNYETGSLTITDIRSEHTGHYEAEIIRSESSGKRQSLNRNRKCDSTKITRKTSSTHDETIKTFSVIISASFQVGNKQGHHMKNQELLLNSAVIAGVSAAVVFLVSVGVAGGIYYHHRRSRKETTKAECV